MSDSKDYKIDETSRLAYYARVSTNEQDKENRQDDIVRGYLAKFGITFAKDFSDKQSGYKLPYEKRNDLAKLIRAVEKGDYDGIVVSDRDRLTRQTDEHFSLRRLFKQLNIPVFIASRDERYDQGDLIKNLVEDGLTKLESDNISVRTRAAMQTLINDGQYVGGRPPFGYEPLKEPVKKQGEEILKVVGFKEKYEEAALIKEIFSLYQTSESFNGIAKIMNKKNNPIRHWTADKVKFLITNPIYSGYFAYNRTKGNKGGSKLNPIDEWKLVRCQWIEKPIISKQEWLYCWDKYQQSRKASPYYLRTSFYFQDLLICHCGSKMKGKDERTNKKNSKGKDGYRYYKCTNKTCNQKIEVDKIEDPFEQFFNQQSKPLDLIVKELEARFQDAYHETMQLIDTLTSELKYLKLDYELFNREVNRLDTADVYLKETKNPTQMGYLIAKNFSELKIRDLEDQIKNFQHQADGYDRLIKSNIIIDVATKVCRRKFRDYDTDQAKRHLVLLLLKECKMATPNEISFTFYSHPPQSYTIK